MYPTVMQLRTMSAQQVFDHAARHMLLQGHQGRDTQGRCMYRSDSGPCAVGSLIPEELYAPWIEHRNVSVLATDGIVPIDLRHFAQRHLHLLAGLQRVHDCQDPSRWMAALCELARLYGLSSDKIIGLRPSLEYQRDNRCEEIERQRERVYMALDELPAHQPVTLTKGMKLGKFPVFAADFDFFDFQEKPMIPPLSFFIGKPQHIEPPPPALKSCALLA